jgi:hypothetical protein
MAEHDRLQIPLPEAAPNQQAKQTAEEPIPQSQEHGPSLDCWRPAGEWRGQSADRVSLPHRLPEQDAPGPKWRRETLAAFLAEGARVSETTKLGGSDPVPAGAPSAVTEASSGSGPSGGGYPRALCARHGASCALPSVPWRWTSGAGP